MFFALQGIFMAISIGSGALVARAWGAGDREEAARVTAASVGLAALATIVVMLFGAIFSTPIARWFGLDDATTRLAADNVFWMALLIGGVAVNVILCGALRAAGDVWMPLAFVTIVNIVNVPLLYAFVFGQWGAPASQGGNPAAAQIVAAECVVLAETKDHLDWELLGKCADKLQGDQANALREACEEVEEEEDEHLYHTKGWCRELWIEALGMKAVLPPPEEARDVKTAIGAARAEQSAPRRLGLRCVGSSSATEQMDR